MSGFVGGSVCGCVGFWFVCGLISVLLGWSVGGLVGRWVSSWVGGWVSECVGVSLGEGWSLVE